MANKRSNWKVYNLTLTTAGTEYSQAVQSGAKFVGVQCRSMDDIRMAMVANDTTSGNLFWTIPAGSAWQSQGPLPAGTKTFYFSCANTSGVVVEIEEWT